MADLECPYCGADNEACHDDGAGYDESQLHEMQCCQCDKYFTFNTTICFYYEPHKADCLNDGNHQWVIRNSYPKHHQTAQMECKTCDATRPMTDEEWYERVRS